MTTMMKNATIMIRLPGGLCTCHEGNLEPSQSTSHKSQTPSEQSHSAL